MDEIEGLLDLWFCAEYAARTQHPADGKSRQELRKEAAGARSELAYTLAKLAQS